MSSVFPCMIHQLTRKSEGVANPIVRRKRFLSWLASEEFKDNIPTL